MSNIEKKSYHHNHNFYYHSDIIILLAYFVFYEYNLIACYILHNSNDLLTLSLYYTTYNKNLDIHKKYYKKLDYKLIFYVCSCEINIVLQHT